MDRKEIIKHLVESLEFVYFNFPIQPTFYSVKSGEGLELALNDFAVRLDIPFHILSCQDLNTLRLMLPNTNHGNWASLVAVIEVDGLIRHMVTYVKGADCRLVLTTVDDAI